MIHGALTTLRPISAADLPIMRPWFDDPETMRFWAQPRPFLRDDEFENDLHGRFASFERAGYFTILDPTGNPIGRIDFDTFDERNRSCEIGILIGDPEARNKRYGTDAMIALMRYLFLERNLHRIELTVLDWNERAIRAYRRIGFVDEGILRDHRFADGRYVAELKMSMLKPEFARLYPSPAPS